LGDSPETDAEEEPMTVEAERAAHEAKALQKRAAFPWLDAHAYTCTPSSDRFFNPGASCGPPSTWRAGSG
jgi:hypothetical protein